MCKKNRKTPLIYMSEVHLLGVKILGEFYCEVAFSRASMQRQET